MSGMVTCGLVGLLIGVVAALGLRRMWVTQPSKPPVAKQTPARREEPARRRHARPRRGGRAGSAGAGQAVAAPADHTQPHEPDARPHAEDPADELGSIL